MIESWIFWAILSAAFAALVTILAKLGLTGIDPDVAQLIRTAIVLPALALLVLTTGKWHGAHEWTGRTWLFLVLSGLATGASWVCYFRALNVGLASRVAAVDKFSVVLVALMAAVILHERPGTAGWCGICLITAGLVIITLTK